MFEAFLLLVYNSIDGHRKHCTLSAFFRFLIRYRFFSSFCWCWCCCCCSLSFRYWFQSFYIIGNNLLFLLFALCALVRRLVKRIEAMPIIMILNGTEPITMPFKIPRKSLLFFLYCVGAFLFQRASHTNENYEFRCVFSLLDGYFSTKFSRSFFYSNDQNRVSISHNRDNPHGGLHSIYTD